MSIKPGSCSRKNYKENLTKFQFSLSSNCIKFYLRDLQFPFFYPGEKKNCALHFHVNFMKTTFRIAPLNYVIFSNKLLMS